MYLIFDSLKSDNHLIFIHGYDLRVLKFFQNKQIFIACNQKISALNSAFA